MNNLLYYFRYSFLRSNSIRENAYRIFYRLYAAFHIPIKASIIRKKKKIKVLFILQELGLWKSEELFLAMLKNDRFDPTLIVAPVKPAQEIEISLVKYLEKKNYKYFVYEKGVFKRSYHPDIIFYQKPYGNEIKELDYWNNFNSLFLYVAYAFHGEEKSYFCSAPLNNLAWQNYFENYDSMKNMTVKMPNKGKNCLLTGLPMTDIFLKGPCHDPWKYQTKKKKKRIIYAPHHTISPQEWLSYSTFLQYHSFMKELAIKYADEVQWAFKPHPSLRKKLEIMWGEEETEAYYAWWKSMGNTQYEAGDYVDLMLTSDAMIHDCGSFTIEYHYSRKPVLFLDSDGHKLDDMNDFAIKAYEMHYHGKNEDDIEQFVIKVINGSDPMLGERLDFYENCLSLPYGKTASENIIDCILNKQSEKKAKAIDVRD